MIFIQTIAVNRMVQPMVKEHIDIIQVFLRHRNIKDFIHQQQQQHRIVNRDYIQADPLADTLHRLILNTMVLISERKLECVYLWS